MEKQGWKKFERTRICLANTTTDENCLARCNVRHVHEAEFQHIKLAGTKLSITNERYGLTLATCANDRDMEQLKMSETTLNTQPEKTKIIEVAAAVLLREGNGEAVGHPAASPLRGQRSDGSFLLAQRPSDKIWAGYWEFPGGKIEPGESARGALVRELREELGIEVVTAYPWITRVFTYPHATVRLSFFRVTEWSGELHPHEGQEFVWQANPPQPPFSKVGSNCSVFPILPANTPILRALELPSLYAISNAAELGVELFLTRLQASLDSGLQLIQLREKNLSREMLRELALRVVALAHARGAKVLLNGDVELVQEVGADGVQLTSTQLAELKDRPAVDWCAASCHNAEELHRAEALGCDFALLSPVLPTKSHPGVPHLGWESFESIAAGSSIPVYALGGLNHGDIQTAWQHGAHGVSLLRQAW